MSKVTQYQPTAFYATRNMFREAIGFTAPLSYQQWSELSDDYKTSALFVQFFREINLAWVKTKSFFVIEEDGVDTAIQYLMKVTPQIKENPNKFSAKYIYTVMKNCLYCISHDLKGKLYEYENRMDWAFASVSSTTSAEIDILNYVSHLVSDPVKSESIDFDPMEYVNRESFWKMIEAKGDETSKLVDHIVRSGIPKKFSPERRAVFESLKEFCEGYKAFYYDEESL